MLTTSFIIFSDPPLTVYTYSELKLRMHLSSIIHQFDISSDIKKIGSARSTGTSDVMSPITHRFDALFALFFLFRLCRANRTGVLNRIPHAMRGRVVINRLFSYRCEHACDKPAFLAIAAPGHACRKFCVHVSVHWCYVHARPTHYSSSDRTHS